MAITASELRIGNYVFDGNRELTQVKSIIEGAINYELDYGNLWANQECYFENLNPIPITEEWLLKFGFEKCEYLKNTWDNGSIIISLKYDIFYYELLNGTVDIKYIHQLQNLYFALTGKELIYGNNPN